MRFNERRLALYRMMQSEELNAEMLSRLASPDRRVRDAAFLELILQAMLRQVGCEVVSHPVLPGTPERPDFKVVPAVGSPFLLEATVDTGLTNEQHRRYRRHHDLSDRVDAIQHQEFLIEAGVC